jgi:hypothetical protein
MMIGLLSVGTTIQVIHKLIVTPGIVRQIKTTSRDGCHINVILKIKNQLT